MSILRAGLLILMAVGVPVSDAAAQLRDGSAVRGAAAFQPCGACHSVAPGVQLTGPSLAHIWDRRAGTVDGFTRYSEPLRRATVVCYFAWEMAQAPVFTGMPAGWVRATLMCARATLGDGVLVAVVAIAGALLYRDRRWFVPPTLLRNVLVECQLFERTEKRRRRRSAASTAPPGST